MMMIMIRNKNDNNKVMTEYPCMYRIQCMQVREMLAMGTVLSTVPGAVQCTVQDTVRGTVQGAVCLACMYIVNMDTCNMYGHAHRYVRTRAQKRALIRLQLAVM